MAAHLTSSGIQPLFGHLTDKKRFPTLMPAGLLLFAVGIALMPLAPDLRWLIALVVVLGLGTAAFHPEGFKATACVATARRATGMSLFSVGGNLGFALGAPAAVFLASRLGLAGTSALAIPSSIGAALWLPTLPLIRVRIAGAGAGTRGPGVDRPLFAMAVLAGIVVLRTWTQIGLATFIPFLYRAELDRNPGFVETLLFLFLGSGTVGTLPGEPLGDRFGHRRRLFASLALQVPLIALFLTARG